jgi:hypothetical protein
MEAGGRSLLSLSQQHRRAGSSRDQTSLRFDVGFEVIQDGGGHIRWHRAGESHSKGAVRFRVRRRRPQAVSEAALADGVGVVPDRGYVVSADTPDKPPTHQNSQTKTQSRLKPAELEPLRYARKVHDGRGLYLLMMPHGGRYWRFNYRFRGKHKTLALGIHPDISRQKARARHQIARTWLADGIDPSVRKRQFGNSTFAKRPV